MYCQYVNRKISANVEKSSITTELKLVLVNGVATDYKFTRFNSFFVVTSGH